MALPSLHLASFLILTVHVFRSDDTVGIPSARAGTMFRFLSAWYRLGNMNWIARAAGTSPTSNGFRVWSCASRQHAVVPPSVTRDVGVPPTHAATMNIPPHAMAVARRGSAHC